MFQAISDHVLIFDGAMGTQIQASNLSAEDFDLNQAIKLSADEGLTKKLKELAPKFDAKSLEGCNELLNLTRPELIKKIHKCYLDAGSDLIETNTFGATSIVLSEYGLEDLVYEICFAAAKIACQAADESATSENPKFAIGAIGPGTKLLSLGQIPWQEYVDTYRTGFLGLIHGGVQGLLIETLQDLLGVKAAVIAAKEAMDEAKVTLPLIVQVTIEQTGTMLMGSEIDAAINMLEAFPFVTAIGMNCATGPEEMVPYVRRLSTNSIRPISIQPNAGLPIMEKGRAIYMLTPQELGAYQKRFVNEFGVAFAGGCCGTTPDHIREVAKAVKGAKHSAPARWIQNKHLFQDFNYQLRTNEQLESMGLIGCSSLFQFQPYEQDSSILYVGEKTNANGSKAFREMLANENWDGLTELAREQEAEGSHLLDVCSAYVGRDEVRDMSLLLTQLNKSILVPLVIDSTEVPVIEASLQHVAGKPIVNSINFEDGDNKARRILSLCQKYGAAIVALVIDEGGMAKTVEKKLEVADRLIDICHEFGIADHDIFIDMLTFTLGSGDEEFRKAGQNTIEAIAKLKEKYPKVNTILGVSNISFGLKPSIRQVINSCFLHEATKAGLTSAIVHVGKLISESKIEPEVWQLTEDLVYDRRRFSK